MTPPRSPLTAHVLDTTTGRPARGVAIRLDVQGAGDAWVLLAEELTDDDGRVQDLLAPGALAATTYRITFDVGAYFRAAGRAAFYPRVEIVFTVTAPDEHHHIPLLLSPFGYSTYRGS